MEEAFGIGPERAELDDTGESGHQEDPQFERIGLTVIEFEDPANSCRDDDYPKQPAEPEASGSGGIDLSEPTSTDGDREEELQGIDISFQPGI